MIAVVVAIVASAAAPCPAQLVQEHIGEVVPRDVREMYDRGLQYLVKTQTDDGGWSGGEDGPGVTGMGLMAFLASGEDPNFGLYSKQVRKAVKNIIRGQNASTGYLGNSMYHHGFAMLALAEAYGAVDDRNLWTAAEKGNGRSIGAALELAVRAAITSQKKNSLRRLALLARRERRRHLGQRRRPRRPLGRTQRRHRSPRRSRSTGPSPIINR